MIQRDFIQLILTIISKNLEGNDTDYWDFNEFSASMHKKRKGNTVLEINVYPFNIHRKSKDLPKRCFHSFLYYVPLYMK